MTRSTRFTYSNSCNFGIQSGNHEKRFVHRSKHKRCKTSPFSLFFFFLWNLHWRAGKAVPREDGGPILSRRVERKQRKVHLSGRRAAELGRLEAEAGRAAAEARRQLVRLQRGEVRGLAAVPERCLSPRSTLKGRMVFFILMKLLRIQRSQIHIGEFLARIGVDTAEIALLSLP